VTLQGADIKDYHSKVFEDFGLPPHAWTPYLALGNAQTREERAEAERIWGLMLNQDGGGYADEGLEFFGILHDRAAAERRRRRDEGRDMSDLGNDPKNEPASYLLQRIQPDFGDLLWEGFQDMGDWMISPFSQKEVGANERQTAAYRTRLKAKRPVQQEELALRASAASRSSNSLARQSGLGRASGRSPFAQNRAFGSLGKFKSTPQESADPYELRKKVQRDRVGAPTAHRKIVQNPSGLAPSAPPSDPRESPEGRRAEELIGSSDYWRSDAKQKEVRSLFERMYPQNKPEGPPKEESDALDREIAALHERDDYWSEPTQKRVRAAYQRRYGHLNKRRRG